MMKKAVASLFAIVFLILVGFILVKYWSYVFARTVTGVISDVQRVAPPAVLLGGANATSREMFSFAVAIREETGEIMTASSEDRQWAVAQPGQCAQAKFFPYPPWNFEKAGTFFGARLTRLYVCDSGKMLGVEGNSPQPKVGSEPSAVVQEPQNSNVEQAPAVSPSPLENLTPQVSPSPENTEAN